MSYIHYNPNPKGIDVGDCVIRALSKALNYSWEKTYAELCAQGFMMGNLPSANSVWGTYLLSKGFEEKSLIRRCRECYTLIDFCREYPDGIFVVGTDDHAVAIINGDYYDSYDSGNVNPTYYFEKQEEKNNG